MKRTCTKCNETKSISKFRREKSGKDGYRAECKSCSDIRDKAYRAKNKEKIKEYNKVYCAKNKEERKVKKKIHYNANKEKLTAQSRAWAAANKEWIKKYKKDYYAVNKEKIKAYNRELYAKNLERHKDGNLRRIHNITLADYKQMLEDQDGRCKICRKKPGKKMLAVDHCHKTLKIRGLLCGNCNQGLGRFKDDLSLLLRAAAYLEEHNQ